ncbi:MAG: GIY-YIG nuclease family protein [Candidatus Cloacimonadota bacterium]|nr:GIY-YIG nuclease family protein [Candidatus Cloacimonadota bacterium]
MKANEILRNLYKKKDFNGLINYCNFQIALDDSKYILFGARGKAYIEIEKFDKAVIDISRAVELNQNYALGYYNRGICYYFIDKYELAISDLEKAKSMDNEFDCINFYLGGSYSLIENYEKGIELFTEHLKNYEDEVAVKWRASLYWLTEQFEKANNDFTKILIKESQYIENFENINKIDTSKGTNPNLINNSFDFNKIGFSILTKKNKCSGIYILEFNNYEYYIGQSKKIQNRIKQHLKKYNDIKSIYFKPITEDLLLSEENTTIAIFEKNTLRIRNLKQIKFLSIFDKNNQEKWVNDTTFNILNGCKVNNNELRKKFHDRYLLLKRKPYFDQLIFLLSKYLKCSIPNYIASEFNYWNITCLPKYLEKENCISRININAVPILSIFEKPNNSLIFMLYVSKLPFLRYIKQNKTLHSFFKQIPSLKMDLRDAFEEKTEGDEIKLLIDQKDFENFLDNQLMLSSIRLFNLRMMNNTGKEKKHRRRISHCLDLSDIIIERIEHNNGDGL